MKLYHCTTPKKAKAYRITGYIKAPVRGFNTIEAALAWCVKVGRSVIYEINTNKFYKLPDHHNQFGEAYWSEENIKDFKCVYSAKQSLEKHDKSN